MQIDSMHTGLCNGSLLQPLSLAFPCSHSLRDRCPLGPCLCFCDCSCAGMCLRKSTPRCRCCAPPSLLACGPDSASACGLVADSAMQRPPAASAAPAGVAMATAAASIAATAVLVQPGGGKGMTQELARLLGKRSAEGLQGPLHDCPAWKRPHAVVETSAVGHPQSGATSAGVPDAHMAD
mmetsp:Transcript_32608/g.82207  ORF Transcript_32608/g.82207 Transcript_32608/m.82207 type:complete len:180 (+) Transcript_32608:85-624(+)